MVDQVRTIGEETADFVTARFLLKPRGTYEQAVKSFEPYREIKDAHEEARTGIKKLLGRACLAWTRKRYIYVNNRLEGSAPWTISAVLEAMASERPSSKELPGEVYAPF